MFSLNINLKIDPKCSTAKEKLCALANVLDNYNLGYGEEDLLCIADLAARVDCVDIFKSLQKLNVNGIYDDYFFECAVDMESFNVLAFLLNQVTVKHSGRSGKGFDGNERTMSQAIINNEEFNEWLDKQGITIRSDIIDGNALSEYLLAKHINDMGVTPYEVYEDVVDVLPVALDELISNI